MRVVDVTVHYGESTGVRDIGEFSGEIREMLFEKTFFVFSRKKTIGGPWNADCPEGLHLVHWVQ